MSRQRIMLVGASGLIGDEVVRQAAGLADVALLGLGRSEMQMPPGARFELLLADPANWDTAIATIRPDAVICALGTTRRKAGGNEAFYKVDHDLVLKVARAARDAGAEHFVHISSVGADMASRNFYLRTKGEVEVALQKLRFRRLDILRPGLLRGQRAGEFRLGERIAMALSPLTDLLLWGSWTRYRSIAASDVAAAALQAAREKPGGAFVYQHDGILRLKRRFGPGGAKRG